MTLENVKGVKEDFRLERLANKFTSKYQDFHSIEVFSIPPNNLKFFIAGKHPMSQCEIRMFLERMGYLQKEARRQGLKQPFITNR